MQTHHVATQDRARTNSPMLLAGGSGAARISIERNVVCPVLIGRDGPVATARETLQRARESLGGTLLVSGDAGVGKTRLVRSLVDDARALGFVTLQGACFEADRAHPFAPILDLVRVLAATTSPALAAHYFAPASADLVTLFPELRSIFADATPREALDPQEDRRRLFHALTAAVASLGSVQPLLLVLEDVHWSDDATLDLVLHLARRVVSQPIVLALTFRSDEIGPRLARLLADLDRTRCAVDLPLRPLGVTDVSAMLEAIFGQPIGLGTSFVERLHGFTEGNPFFVEEMLKALMVAGDLVCANGAWRARPLEHVRVPRTATEAVGRRLAGLSDHARALASVAAVAGRRFEFRLLQAVTRHDERELLRLVKELIDAQLVIEESADRFAFRHALTRETIRSQLLARERTALHRAIAQALEDHVAGDDAVDRDDALSYHAFEAGMWDVARRHALRAATHALTLCAPREALQQLERAVAATASAGGRPDAFLLTTRGRAHETLGIFSRADDDFSAALALARAEGDRHAEWTCLHALGMLWAARDYDRAGTYRREALEVARAIGDPTLLAHSLNRVGNWHVNRDDPYSGIPHHDEALAIFERAGDRRGVAETVDLLAMAHHIAGAQEAAVALYERSVELFSALEHRRGLGNAFTVLQICGPSHQSSSGRVLASRHLPDLVADESAVRIARDIGWRAGEAFSRFSLADCLGWAGAYGRALRLGRESLGIAREIDHLQWQAAAHRVLGSMAMDLCAMDDAIGHFQAAHDIALRLGSAVWIRWTASPLAIALARAGDTARATSLLDGVVRMLPAPVSHCDTRRTMGEHLIVLARAEIALADGRAEEVLSLVDEREAIGVPRVAFLRARAHAMLERWDALADSLGRARRDAQEQGARPLLWRIAALEGSAHLKQRRRLEARCAFDAARALASELEAELADPALAATFRTGVDEFAPPPPEPTANRAAKAAFGGLTRRERDTAALIAQGRSNRAIARALGIGERTVEGYVASALAKLGFESRAQIAVWAAEQRLAVDAVLLARR